MVPILCNQLLPRASMELCTPIKYMFLPLAIRVPADLLVYVPFMWYVFFICIIVHKVHFGITYNILLE